MPAAWRAFTMVFELDDLRRHAAARPVTNVGGEEGDRVVAPVVPQTAVAEDLVVDEAVNRQELDRGDVEVAQVTDDGVAGEAERTCRAAPRARPGAEAEPLHVRLVDDRAPQRRVRRRVVLPVEGRIDDDAEGRPSLIALRADEIPVGVARRRTRWSPCSKSSMPPRARAYGSRSTFAGLNRSPFSGSHGPSTR